jgi:hypothetical protein
MLRETTFRLGGALTIALGGALAAALYLAGAGWVFFDAWLGAGLCVGFGVFFLYVAEDEGRTRREQLRTLEAPSPGPPGARPP